MFARGQHASPTQRSMCFSTVVSAPTLTGAAILLRPSSAPEGFLGNGHMWMRWRSVQGLNGLPQDRQQQCAWTTHLLSCWLPPGSAIWYQV